jgi:hypothetical protein
VRAVPGSGELTWHPELAPARARGEQVYLEASALTKLTPRPST